MIATAEFREPNPVTIKQNDERKVMIQDIKSGEQTQEALTLLKILSLGQQQIEAEETSSIKDVAHRLRNRSK